MTYTVALFGEAERGEFNTAYFCQDLAELDQYFGNPPPESRGLYYAVQALMFKRQLIFFRVMEEGFSIPDYMTGVHMLEEQHLFSHLDAIFIPGVGDPTVIHAMQPLCKRFHSILVSTESDFYDYLTASQS